MKTQLSWQYDEFKQVGRDYGKSSEVDGYDASQAEFRDVEAENDEIGHALDIKRSDVVIDFGSGTGAFAIQAARRCRQVHAVDVSEAMLAYAKRKSESSRRHEHRIRPRRLFDP